MQKNSVKKIIYRTLLKSPYSLLNINKIRSHRTRLRIKLYLMYVYNLTIYLLTVVDSLNVIQCITLVSLFSSISIGSFWDWNLQLFHFSLFKKPSGATLILITIKNQPMSWIFSTYQSCNIFLQFFKNEIKRYFTSIDIFTFNKSTRTEQD